MMYQVRKNVITTKNKVAICKGLTLFHNSGVWDNVELITSRKELNDFMKDRYSKVEDRFDRNGEYLYTRFTEYVVYERYTDVNEEKLPSIIMVSNLEPMFELERLINSVKDEDYDTLIEIKNKNGYRNKKQLIDFLISEYDLCLMTEQNNTIYLKTRIINNTNDTCFVLHLDFEENKDGIKIIDVY